MTHAASSWRAYFLFGYHLYSDFPFVTPLASADGPPDLTFTCTLVAPAEADSQQAVPLLHTPQQRPGGESIIPLYRLGDGGLLLRFTQMADFYLWPDRIVCHLLNPAYHYMVEIQFLGTVMAFWLEQQGLVALHASAVVVDGRGVAFLSSNKGGKSTLAAAFLAAGHSLLTDDILPMQQAAGGFLGRPGYPQMRFWPDQANHFLGHYQDLALIHPAYDKRRVPIGQPAGFGTFHPDACPLSAIYLPERDADCHELTITPVPPRQAVIELLRFSFLHHLVTHLGHPSRRFDFFTKCAQQLAVRRLRYPSGWQHLPAVVSLLKQDSSCLSS